MRFRKGELIYVPSKSLLLEDSSDPIAFMFTDRPNVLLVVSSENEDSYGVLHEGCRWLVKKDQAYKVHKHE
jgi:hypothetical protein